MAAKKTQTLADRIEALWAEIDAFIDARVEATAVECPGVPKLSLRHILTRGRCQCEAYRLITKELNPQ